MHPHGCTENFYWPTRDDETYVLFGKILLKVNTPNNLSRSGRQYKVSISEVQQTVEKNLQKEFCRMPCYVFFCFILKQMLMV